jgi:hypothetical protein
LAEPFCEFSLRWRNQAKVARIPHRRCATHGVLFHQSASPIGPHTGKFMERVPASGLMQIRTQNWAKTANGYREILKYIDRHLPDIEARSVKEQSAFPPL